MKQYNTRVSVQLDFNFISSAGDSMTQNEIIAGIVNMLKSAGVRNITGLQGYQENNVNFKVENIQQISSPEEDIETDLEEFDIFN